MFYETVDCTARRPGLREGFTDREEGWREARYLSERLIKMGIDDFYVSPLGRARATASFTLDRLGQTAEVKDWLQEFPARIQEPSRPGEQKIAWDWLPEDWTKEERFYQADHWFEVEDMRKGHVKELYDQVAAGLDEMPGPSWLCAGGQLLPHCPGKYRYGGPVLPLRRGMRHRSAICFTFLPCRSGTVPVHCPVP